jgi:hypothetical protein
MSFDTVALQMGSFSMQAKLLPPTHPSAPSQVRMRAGASARCLAEKGIEFKHLAPQHSKTRPPDFTKHQDKYRMNPSIFGYSKNTQ